MDVRDEAVTPELSVVPESELASSDALATRPRFCSAVKIAPEGCTIGVELKKAIFWLVAVPNFVPVLVSVTMSCVDIVRFPPGVKAPVDVIEVVTTPEARVVPVSPLAGTAAAVIDVLQANPLPLVHCNALAAVLHDGTLWPVGATAVKEPKT